ncbi:hypothetical protein OAT16_01825 [Prolixibacteraceae bacterium]|nr:hypothetical protein [Prolixibacteraceae bacterium]
MLTIEERKRNDKYKKVGLGIRLKCDYVAAKDYNRFSLFNKRASVNGLYDISDASDVIILY